jgi:hypothetical protein
LCENVALALDRVREKAVSVFYRHPERTLLFAYYDGELSPLQNRRIARHLDNCAQCRHQCELESWQIERLLTTNREAPAASGVNQRDEFQDLLRSIRSSPVVVTRALLSLQVGRKATAQEGAGIPPNRMVKLLTVFILVATVIHVLVGLVAWSGWQLTGAGQALRHFFGTAGDLFLVELAAAGLYLALQVLRGFSKGEPLYKGWFLITTACGCDLAGLIVSKLLATRPNSVWLDGYGPILYQFGQFLAGPLRLVLLACGLLSILRAFYRAGILTLRFRLWEYAILACLGSYTLVENVQAAAVRNAGGLWSLSGVIESLNDPLLLFVLLAVLLVRRSARDLGGRYLTHCWTAMAWAFGMIFLGNITTWAFSYSYLPLWLTSIGWNVWFLAGAGFPLACSFQLQAMGRTAEWVETRKTGDASSPIAS